MKTYPILEQEAKSTEETWKSERRYSTYNTITCEISIVRNTKAKEISSLLYYKTFIPNENSYYLQ